MDLELSNILSYYFDVTLKKALGYHDEYSPPSYNPYENIIFFAKKDQSEDLKNILVDNPEIVSQLKESLINALKFYFRGVQAIRLIFNQNAFGIEIPRGTPMNLNLASYIGVVINFDYPSDITYKFLHGQCGALTLELSRLTNWPIYAIFLTETGQVTPHDVPAHYVILTPFKLFLDIIGLRSARELISSVPTEFGYPDYRVSIHASDRSLTNKDFTCSESDMIFANFYATDIIKKLRYMKYEHR